MSNLFNVSFILTAFALSILCSPLITQAQPAPSPGFTDVTQSSGMSDIIQTAHKSFQENIKTGNRWWISGLDFIDLRGQGLLDLFVSGHGTQAFICRNDGNGHFSWIDPRFDIPRGKKANFDLPVPGGELRLAYDLNEDGRPDLFTSWGDDAGVFYFNDISKGIYNFKRPPRLDYFMRSCAVLDFDGDGFADFLCNTGDNGVNNGIRICFGDKDHNFSRIKEIPGENRLGIPADLSGDGSLDLVLGTGAGFSQSDLGTRILRFNKDYTYTDISEASGVAPKSGYRVQGVMDLNHDGYPDLLCMSNVPGNQRVTAWINDGKGHFKLQPDLFKDLDKAGHLRFYGWGDASMIDLDNDGIPDILINGRTFLWVFRGMPDGTYQYANTQWHIPEQSNGRLNEGRCFGDYDNDGMIDLAVCQLAGTDNEYDSFRLLHNDLPHKNFIRVRPVGPPGNRVAAGAKIRIYEPNSLGDPTKLIAYEVATIWGNEGSHSYYTAAQTERHFGLGERKSCDISVEFRPSGKKVEKKNADANRIITMNQETGEITERELK